MKSILAASLLLASFAASAHHSTPPPPTPLPPSQSQTQGQHQGQDQHLYNVNDNDNRNTNTSVSSATGGNAVAGGASNSGNSNVTVNTGGSDREGVVFIPPVVPASPAATIGVGDVVATVGACGPLQTIVHTPVQGTYVGLFKKSRIEQGYDDTLAPYIVNGVQQDYREVRLPNGDIRLMGHQPLTFVSVVGVAAARNLALGGGHASDWGQAGGGSSSSMQQIVTRIQLRECEVGTLHHEAPPVVQVIALPARPHHVHHHFKKKGCK